MNRHPQETAPLVFAPRIDTSSNDPVVLKRALMHMEAQVCHMRRRLKEIQKNVVGREAFDPVAGVLNREGILQSFDAQILRIENRESFGGTVILVDVDNFKDIAANHGRYVLLLCIKQIADMMSDDLLCSGEVGYLDNGEFLVLLPDISKNQILDDAQALRSRLDRIAFEWNGKAVQVKSSVELHSYTTPTCVESLLKRSECYLNREKKYH